jgi:general secretion pathway protein D
MTFKINSLHPAVWMIVLVLGGCAYAPWEKGGVAGTTPEERVANARQQVESRPDEAAPRKDLHLTKEQGIAQLMMEAERARAERRFEEAGKLYDRLLVLSPDNNRALAGRETIERERKHEMRVAEARRLVVEKKPEVAQAIVREVLLENPVHPGALDLQKELRAKRETMRSEPPQLKPPFEKPVTLELREANIKMVFEALSRATGINFILDKDIKPDTKATVFIKKARIEDAIEMVLATNGLQKKALSETSALVFPNTQQKLKDYQDLMIRSFYLTNGSAKQVATLIKTMLKTKDIYVDERLNMLVMRDTPEVIRIAEKLVSGNDLPDPEVMLEIEVLEISRNRLQELGIEYPTRFAAEADTLRELRNITSDTISVEGDLAVNLRKTLGDVNLLSNPRIRVKNNEKAKILVGDKVPIITTTSTANVGVSSSVQYIDVGLKLDVEPRIALDDYVNIKIGLEVSSLGDVTETNGTIAYRIGTRNATTLLRLKDGETQILAGLISDDERKSTSKVPGLGEIPLLGKLFANEEASRGKTEIVLAITPRILGNISRPDAEIAEYWSGTETGITDKPQIVVPAGSGTSTASNRNNFRPVPREALPEPETQPETPPVKQVEPPETPEVAPATVPPAAEPAAAP